MRGFQKYGKIEFSWWLFEGRPRQVKNMLPDGLNWLCYFAGSSKSHCENLISFIFLESPHQADVKNVIKSYKHFFGYFNTLKTRCNQLKDLVMKWKSTVSKMNVIDLLLFMTTYKLHILKHKLISIFCIELLLLRNAYCQVYIKLDIVWHICQDKLCLQKLRLHWSKLQLYLIHVWNWAIRSSICSIYF